MHNIPFFSIIIPTYNRAYTIGDSIHSILAQNYEDFEVIIVDDGSTDDTRATVDHFKDPRIQYVRIDNSERGVARNVGIKKARGEYITFLDSDDVLYSNHLSRARQICEERAFPEMFRIAFEIKDQQGRIIEQSVLHENTVNNALIYGNILACLGVFIKAEIIKEFLFIEDRRLAGTEDYELWLRLGSRFSIWNDNTITAAIMHHENRSVTQQDIPQLIQRIQLFIQYVFSDRRNEQVYSDKKNFFKALRYSYIALHAALARKKDIGLHYLYKAFVNYPLIVVYKRFYIIIFKLIVN